MASKPRNYRTRLCDCCLAEYSYTAYQSLYCSKTCRAKILNARRVSRTYTLFCECCKTPITAQTKGRRFCTPQCKGKHKYITGEVTTESQYEKISGSWVRYLSRLLYAAGRRRDKLTRQDLLEIITQQNYKCAISGLPLTCKLEKGTKFWSNASVDRILAGGSYEKNNIQLVCRAVNSWRSDMPLEDFIQVCKAVASYQERLEVQDGRA